MIRSKLLWALPALLLSVVAACNDSTSPTGDGATVSLSVAVPAPAVNDVIRERTSYAAKIET